MSCQWKIKGMGGAAKQHTYFCHCCSTCHSDNLTSFRIGVVRCSFFVNDENEKSYCHDIETTSVMEEIKLFIDYMESKY